MKRSDRRVVVFQEGPNHFCFGRLVVEYPMPLTGSVAYQEAQTVCTFGIGDRLPRWSLIKSTCHYQNRNAKIVPYSRQQNMGSVLFPEQIDDELLYIYFIARNNLPRIADGGVKLMISAIHATNLALLCQNLTLPKCL